MDFDDMYGVNIFETILKTNTVFILKHGEKMDKALRIFCSVYLILILFGVYSILIWGGLLRQIGFQTFLH
jgi:hypothetical protein